MRKGDRLTAWRRWQRLAKHPENPLSPDTSAQDFQDLMDGLERWKNSQFWANDGGQYIHMPATWLNKCLWTEHPLPVRVTQSIPVGPRSQAPAPALTQADRDHEEFMARARRNQEAYDGD
ncbi:MAG TPA: hypothetical protein VGN26_04070 [Armatimonadota bacterium]